MGLVRGWILRASQRSAAGGKEFQQTSLPHSENSLPLLTPTYSNHFQGSLTHPLFTHKGPTK